MSNVVFVLGAGASRQAGAPLMGDFLDVATDLLRSNRVADAAASFEKVFGAIGGLQAVHSKAQLDLNNIESIFTALELGRVIQRVPGLTQDDIPVTIAALKVLIVKTLEATISFPTERAAIFAPKPYDEFAELLLHIRSKAVPRRTVSVLTFNYDIAVDLAMYRHGLGPNYVIEAPQQVGHNVDLIKLHGSLNWATEKESRRIRPLHFHNFFQKYQISGYGERGTSSIPMSDHLKEYFLRLQPQPVQIDTEPVIVPPSWNKADYHHALSDIWAAAARHLSEAEYVYVIGYSLPETDSFFRHLFALGSVGKAALRQIVVFNPDPAVDDRFRSLLGPGALARYRYRGETFEHSLHVIKTTFPEGP